VCRSSRATHGLLIASTTLVPRGTGDVEALLNL
jgi:hypothetical protein